MVVFDVEDVYAGLIIFQNELSEVIMSSAKRGCVRSPRCRGILAWNTRIS